MCIYGCVLQGQIHPPPPHPAQTLGAFETDRDVEVFLVRLQQVWTQTDSFNVGNQSHIMLKQLADVCLINFAA